MSKNAVVEDPRFQIAASKIIRHKNKVPDAMRIAKYTDAEIEDKTLQQRIRRAAARKSPKESCNGNINSTPVKPKSSSLPSSPSMDKYKPKKVRYSSAATQQNRANAKMEERKYAEVFKYATSLYQEELLKEGGLSAQKVCDYVLSKYNVTIHPRTLQRAIKSGRVNKSPLKKGPQGNFNDEEYLNLQNAFESYSRIQQLNGHGGDITKSKLTQLILQCTKPKKGCDCTWLLKRLEKDSGADMRYGKCNTAEQRRILWTTYGNLKSWFDNWERDLLQLGFAQKQNGRTIIPPDQLGRILNVDETCLVMDGGTSQRGGRPEAIFYSPNLPNLGKATIKSSVATTMITGSTAAGEAIPPHFQFATAAKSDETQRVNVELEKFFVGVKGKFGHAEEKVFPVTFGLNEKGGMDDTEFMKYFKNSILPLFPDVADEDGKRVMAKVDSGPGRLNNNLLTFLRSVGVYLYPGVPNTTAVTQETDQNYGSFKTQFIKNLNEISDIRISRGLSTSLPPWIVGLFVFGGVDPVSGHRLKTSAFEVGFCMEENLKSWAKCGAAPITRAPLEGHSQVRREIGDADDSFNAMMLEIQATNDLSTHFLTRNGFDGSAFKVQINKREEPRQITVPHTVARVEAIANVKTHGQLFHATGGVHLTCDDMQIANEKKLRETEINELQKKKAEFLKMHTIEEKVKAILSKEGPYKLPELKLILQLHCVKKVSSMKLATAKAAYEKILQSRASPPEYETWTDENEERLVYLMTTPITIADTALAREQQVNKIQLFSSVANMDAGELAELKTRLNRRQENLANAAPTQSLAVMPNVDTTATTNGVSSNDGDMGMKQAAI